MSETGGDPRSGRSPGSRGRTSRTALRLPHATGIERARAALRAHLPETQVLALQAAFPEAAYAFHLGSTDWDTAVAKYKETLDAAGRQEIKAEFQRQLEAWLAEHPRS